MSSERPSRLGPALLIVSAFLVTLLLPALMHVPRRPSERFGESLSHGLCVCAVLRAIVGLVRREGGRGWFLYAALLISTPFWAELVGRLLIQLSGRR